MAFTGLHRSHRALSIVQLTIKSLVCASICEISGFSRRKWLFYLVTSWKISLADKNTVEFTSVSIIIFPSFPLFQFLLSDAVDLTLSRPLRLGPPPPNCKLSFTVPISRFRGSFIKFHSSLPSIPSQFYFACPYVSYDRYRQDHPPPPINHCYVTAGIHRTTKGRVMASFLLSSEMTRLPASDVLIFSRLRRLHSARREDQASPTLVHGRDEISVCIHGLFHL